LILVSFDERKVLSSLFNEPQTLVLSLNHKQLILPSMKFNDCNTEFTAPDGHIFIRSLVMFDPN